MLYYQIQILYRTLVINQSYVRHKKKPLPIESGFFINLLLIFLIHDQTSPTHICPTFPAGTRDLIPLWRQTKQHPLGTGKYSSLWRSVSLPANLSRGNLA